MNDDNNNELINHLRERFTENFNTLNKLDITERVFLAKVVRTPNDGIIHAINTVAEERMLMSEQTPSHIDINNVNICSHHQCQQNETLQNTNLISNINYKKSTGKLVLEIWTIKKQSSNKNLEQQASIWNIKSDYQSEEL